MQWIGKTVTDLAVGADALQGVAALIGAEFGQVLLQSRAGFAVAGEDGQNDAGIWSCEKTLTVEFGQGTGEEG